MNMYLKDARKGYTLEIDGETWIVNDQTQEGITGLINEYGDHARWLDDNTQVKVIKL